MAKVPAAALATLAIVAGAQVLAPIDGHNYTIFNAQNNRCALLIEFPNDYVPVLMIPQCDGGVNELWTAHVNPTDPTLVSFSSVGEPESWLSYATAEIAKPPGISVEDYSMHIQAMAHFTPYEWYIGNSPYIAISNSSSSGVLTSYVPRAVVPLQASLLVIEPLNVDDPLQFFQLK